MRRCSEFVIPPQYHETLQFLRLRVKNCIAFSSGLSCVLYRMNVRQRLLNVAAEGLFAALISATGTELICLKALNQLCRAMSYNFSC